MEFRASALKKGVEVNGLSNGVNGDSKDVLTKDIRPAEKKAITIGISDLKIEGFISPSTAVANFLNIPYARIPARFRQAVLVDPRKEKGVHDATRYGPCCPQPVDWVHFRTSHLYETMIEPEHSAEFACLSLNIYAPAASVSSGQRLPVLAWVHGGGFTYGDGGSEYDGNYIVQHSQAIGKPVIVVTMNYRLGFYGFLSSRELRQEAEQHGEVGFANLGFHDQRLAFQWIQKNIHFFGGDGFEITGAGESAGAVALLAHIHSDVPVFQRAFVLSAITYQPIDLSAAQEAFDRLVAKTGLSPEAPGRDKVDALRSLTPDQLKEALSGQIAPPIWDNEWFVDRDAPSALEDIQSFPSWLKGIVIGSTKEECTLFCSPTWTLTSLECVELVKSAFGGGDYADEVLSAYGITPQADGASAREAVVAICTDGSFGTVAPRLASAQTAVPVSLYSFQQRDTFAASTLKGRSYHSLGNAMFFHLPPVAASAPDADMRRTSDALCEAAITLAHGPQPWEPYLQRKRVMVFDGEATGTSIQAKEPRWASLADTREKLARFKNGSREILLRIMREQQAEIQRSSSKSS